MELREGLNCGEIYVAQQAERPMPADRKIRRRGNAPWVAGLLARRKDDVGSSITYQLICVDPSLLRAAQAYPHSTFPVYSSGVNGKARGAMHPSP